MWVHIFCARLCFLVFNTVMGLFILMLFRCYFISICKSQFFRVDKACEMLGSCLHRVRGRNGDENITHISMVLALMTVQRAILIG